MRTPVQILFAAILLLSACRDREVGEHRCDHRAIRAFTAECVKSAKACAGDSDGLPQDCASTARNLYCDYVYGRRSGSGKAWEFVDGQWQVKP